MMMTLKPLCAMMLLATPLATLHAAALDRSGQSTTAFFQKGNYAEVGYSGLMPKVGGVDRAGNAVPEMAEDYEMLSAALKFEVSPESSFAIIYDQPFGAAAKYQGDNNFSATATNSFIIRPATPSAPAVAVPNAAINLSGNTTVEVDSHNTTFLYGYQPMQDVTLFGGAAIQSISGELNLFGPAYGPLSGYKAKLQQDNRLGYVAGFAFEKPEIALRLAVTYRSEIEHRLKSPESIALPKAALAGLTGSLAANAALAPLAAAPVPTIQTTLSGNVAAINTALANPALPAPNRAALETQRAGLVGLLTLAGTSQLTSELESKTEITTPQSVNIDFQTGIMADTLAFANVRWVNWESFGIQPALIKQLTTSTTVPSGLNIVDYAKDQWSANVGVGRKLTPQLSGSVSVGWDSGAGNPITSLGPTEGFYSVGLGARYSPVEHIDLSVGVRYLWLGDAEAKVSSGTIVGNFENNDALAVGLKMGYRF